MRLFIAINFPKETKEKLTEIRDGLKMHALRGKFTTDENLHLTLSFLGEVAGSRISTLLKATGNVPVSPFALCIRGVGRFRRDGGDILWAGVEACKELTLLHSRLISELELAGFEAERRKYTPHLTLAREAMLQDGFDLDEFSGRIGEIHTAVSQISLMKSERISGRLTYTALR